MPSDKRQQRVGTSHDGTTAVEPEPPPLPPPHIPADLLLEILARADAATVVRGAATSKTVRRAILRDPTIGRRVQANHGALLLGVSYAIIEYYSWSHRRRILDTRVSSVGQAPRRKHLGFRAGKQLEWFEPVASRGGLIVLRQRVIDAARLFVWNWNSATTSMPLLPPADPVFAGEYYPDAVHALLTIGDAGRSFQLLLVSTETPPLLTQIYSSEDNRWAPLTEITDVPPELELPSYYAPSRRPEALVLGGGTAVHWLLSDGRQARHIVRLDVGEAKATLIELPPELLRSGTVDVGQVQLAASTDGKLSLVAVAEAELYAISMWTMSAAAAPGEGGPSSASSASWTWTRQVVVRRREAFGWIPTAGRCKDLFLGLEELSSTVILLAHQVGLVRINLRTKEALVLGSDAKLRGIHDVGTLQLCLHETDLPSILLAMKPY